MQESTRWKNERKELEREIGEEVYSRMLTHLKRCEPGLNGFTDWPDVIRFMQSGASDDPRKDVILVAILGAHGEDDDHRWRRILLAAFWPGLESLHLQKRRWDDDPEDLWGNIVGVFLEVVCRTDPAKRSTRLASKLINETRHRLGDEYRRSWRLATLVKLADTEELDKVPANHGGIDDDELDREFAREREVERLRRHADEARIDEIDFLLLVAHRVYGKPIREYAREAGLKYETARKRRQRAERAIRDFEAGGK